MSISKIKLNHINLLKQSMQKWYPYSTKRKGNNAVIIPITVVIALFLLFYDNKNTDSKLLEIQMSMYKLISTDKIILRHSMWQWYPYSTKWEKDNGVIVHIKEPKPIFLLFYDDKNTDSN